MILPGYAFKTNYNMKLFLKILFSCTLLIFTSCSNDSEEDATQLITESQLTGVLGQEITIVGENLEVDKLQFFFDLEEAYLTEFSSTELKIRVPRSLKRYNPELKIINLVTNETILSSNFTLLKPKITGFNSNDITFDEDLIINGENFDDEDIEVLINNQSTKILKFDSSEIIVQIPYEINDSSLEVKIKAQLQESDINQELNLKQPVIEVVENESVWLGSELILKGKNFNPKYQYGEIYINDLKSHFSATNSEIRVRVPSGPYSDFYIQDITYKTANLETNYTTNLEIENSGIMVDYTKNLESTRVFTYNNKAYTFTYPTSSSLPIIELYEFTGVTEKWTKVDGLEFEGYVSKLAVDKNILYLYLRVEPSAHELIKINLDDYSQEEIEFPFHESLHSNNYFAINNALYILFGDTYVNGQTIASDIKYRYSLSTNTWEVLGDDIFTETTWKSFMSNKMLHKEELYFSFGFSGANFKLENDLSLSPVQSGSLLFSYNDVIVARQLNRNISKIYVYNLFDIANTVAVNWREGKDFFTINDTIYYHDFGNDYEGNVELVTFKLKNGFFDAIF